jgi:hypothetical protein
VTYLRYPVVLPLLMCALAARPAPLAADLGDGLPEPGAASDTTLVYRTSGNPLLSFPRSLWTWMVWPLGQATIWAEHEEVPQRVHKFFTNDAGTFGVFPQVQLGGETGTGGGVSLFHNDLFGRDESLEMLYIFSGAGRQRAEALLHDPTVGSGGLFWEAHGAFLETDDEDATINGVVEGREDLEALLGLTGDDVLFGETRADARLSLGWRSNAGPLEDYTPAFTAELRAGWARREVTMEASLLPLIGGETSTATALAVPGLGEQQSYLWTGIRLAWDERDAAPPQRELTHSLRYQFPGRVLLLYDGLYHSYRHLAYPERGGLAEMTFDVARGDDTEFSRLGAEVQLFQPLFWKERVLAGRARLDKVFPSAGLISYADLPTLGGSQRLRGYKRGTYRGEGALLLALEYRWPVWDTWNAFLFWEEGQVFDDFDQIEGDGFGSSIGAGLTLRSEQAYMLGLRIAHSARTKVLLGFSLDHEF